MKGFGSYVDDEEDGKMSKEEIKKALECCAGNIDWLDCNDCPYFKHHCGRGNKLMQDALALITEQEKEIERLRTTLGQCNTELNSALESLKSQCREIGKLRAEVKQAKIDVLNELKEKMFEREYMGVKYRERIFYESDIDEMIEDVKK